MSFNAPAMRPSWTSTRLLCRAMISTTRSAGPPSVSKRNDTVRSNGGCSAATRRARILAWLSAPLLCLLGLGAVLVEQYAALGRWDAFFAFQREFGHSLSNPLATLVAHVSRLGNDPHLPSRLIGLQTLLVACLMGLSAVEWWSRGRSAGAQETMLFVNALLFWLVPLLLGPTVSPYRAEALLVGITPLLGRLPATLLVSLLVLLVVLGGGMSVLFFDDVLV